jgi:hypothetical protein
MIMSLYCFGKIKLKADRTESFTFPIEAVFRREVDAGDAEEIESILKMGTDGIYFSICDDPNTRDATYLWNEARSQPPELVAESRLGKAIHALLFDVKISVGAIAFVDGGIETILKGTPEQCWAWFLERIAKPWDTIDNPILIWDKPE